MNPEISFSLLKEHLKKSQNILDRNDVHISKINKDDETFTVMMQSKIDDEKYILDIKFDNYDEKPPLLEFIDPNTGQKGAKSAYPKCKNDTFFNPYPAICHPCSRNIYSEHSSVHKEWSYSGWQENQYTGNIKTIGDILIAIYYRINDPNSYDGRMT